MPTPVTTKMKKLCPVSGQFLPPPPSLDDYGGTVKAPTREQEHEGRSDGEPGSLSDAPPSFLLRASAEPKARGLLSGSHTSDELMNNKNRNNNWKQQQQQNLAQLPAAMDTGSNTSSIVSAGSTKNKTQRKPQHNKGKPIKNNKTNATIPSSLSCVMTLALVLLILGARPVAAQCSTHGDQPTCDADASAQGTGATTGGACAWDGVSACSTCTVVGVDQATCDTHAVCYWEASACVGQLKFVEYPGWGSPAAASNDPHDVAIDHVTHDMYVMHSQGKKLAVALGGVAPPIVICTHGTSSLFGASIVHRTCTTTEAPQHR